MELYTGFTIVILLGVLAFTPYFTKPDILFGFRVGEKLGRSVEANRLRKHFAIQSLSALIIIFFLSLLLKNVAWRIGGVTLGFLVVNYWMFIIGRQDARRLFEEHKEEITLVKKVIVSTQPRSSRVSLLWFLIPLILIICSVVILYLRYDQLPEQIPMRYDFQGHVTGYEEKSVKTLALLPSVNLVMTLLLFYVFLTTRWAKYDLSGRDLKKSQTRGQQFKEASGILTVYMAILLNLYLFLQLLIMVQIVPYKSWINLLHFALPVLIIVPTIFITLKVGQSGSRLRLENKQEDVEQDITDNQPEMVKDDNQFWKYGIFYHNPDDPSVWVEKRYGFGYTINFARPQAWLFMVLIALLLVVSLVFI